MQVYSYVVVIIHQSYTVLILDGYKFDNKKVISSNKEAEARTLIL